MTFAHTVDEALERFELVSGVGDGKQTACAMSLLNWIWHNDQDGWNDHPECAHPLIRSIVINANDDEETTSEMRAELVRLGKHGILDTWWVPTEVVVVACSRPRDIDPPSQYELAVKVVTTVAEWKRAATKKRPDLTDANLTDANLTDANLTDADLTDADLVRANLTRAYLVRANLTRAYLADARGNADTTLPVGYTVNDSGLIVSKS